MGRRQAMVLLGGLALTACTPATPLTAGPDGVIATESAEVQRRAASTPDAAPVSPDTRVTTGGRQAEAPEAAPVASGVLSLPSLGFSARHTETITPDEYGVVRPTTRDGLARVHADGVLGQLWAVHSGAGSGPGAVLTVPDPSRFVGATGTLPDGTAVVVVDAFISSKSSTVERLNPVLVDPQGIVLVTCQVEGGARRAQYNVALVMRASA